MEEEKEKKLYIELTEKGELTHSSIIIAKIRNDAKQTDKKVTLSIVVFAACAIFVFQTLSLYGAVATGIYHFETKPNNTFQCVIMNSTLETTQGEEIHFKIEWIVLYWKEENRGIATIDHSTTNSNEKDTLINTYKIDTLHACLLLWKYDNTFYFEWIEYAPNFFPLFIVTTIIAIMVFLFSIGLAIWMIFQWKKNNLKNLKN